MMKTFLKITLAALIAGCGLMPQKAEAGFFSKSAVVLGVSVTLYGLHWFYKKYIYVPSGKMGEGEHFSYRGNEHGATMTYTQYDNKGNAFTQTKNLPQGTNVGDVLKLTTNNQKENKVSELE
jgi:hypothetical protein